MGDYPQGLHRVLLVEDSPFLRYAFGRLLRLHGYEVMEASDGQEALNTLEEFRPEVVITDLMLPIMDGITLIQALRENPSMAKIPIVAVTASTSTSVEKRAREAGAIAFLAKPVDIPDLVDRLRTLEGCASR